MTGQRPLDLRLVLPAVAAWAGAFAALARPGSWVAVASPAALGAAAVAWRRGRTAAVVVLLCLGVGLGVAGLRVVALRMGPLGRLAADRAVVHASLLVTSDPQRHPGRSRGQDRAPDLLVVPARLARVTVRGRVLRLRSPVLVLASDARDDATARRSGPRAAPGSWSGLLPGQRVSVTGRLGPARSGQPVAAVLSVRAPPRPVGRPPAVQRAAGELRSGLRAAVEDLPEASRGLVPGLVLGDTSQMPPGLVDDFRTAGLTHLTAVSGANLMIVCGFVLYVGRWLGLRGRWLPAAGALAMAGFVVLARPQPSVLRAAAMGGVGLVALATGRRRGGLAALAAATLGLLLVDPWLARSYGFALSVLATGGLLVLAPGWAEGLQRRGVPLPVAHALAVPAAAQVACAPVVALLSGQVSLVAVPANLLVAPAVAPATILGVLAALAAPVSAPVSRLLGHGAGLPAGWIVIVAERAAAVPVAAASWPATSLGAVGLAVLMLGLVVGARRAARHRRALALSGVALVCASAVVAARPGWPPPGWLMVACDVGQGDALVVSAGAAGVLVVDAGPDPRLVDRCLRGLGIRRVPLVLLTHLHADHVEGLPGVLHGRSVAAVELGPYDEPATELRRVQGWLRGAGVPVVRAVVGERGRLGGLTWQVLWPARVIEGEGSTPNNASIVLLLEREGVRMLLTGDVEPAAQRALMARWRPGPVDVLKVAHHGSAYQAPELLDAVRPRVAVVSVGVDNDYGHPSPVTLHRLTVLGAVVARTDQDGAVAVVGPETRLRVVTRAR